jgi:hypothetical protein
VINVTPTYPRRERDDTITAISTAAAPQFALAGEAHSERG